MRYLGLLWVSLIATMFDCFIYIPFVNNKNFEYKISLYSRFEVFVAVGKKIMVFWDVTMPCSLIDRSIYLSGFFLTAVIVLWKPNAIPLCFSIDLVLNFLSWLLVLLPSTFFVDILFSFSPMVSNS